MPRRRRRPSVGLVHVQQGCMVGVESVLIQPPGNPYGGINTSIHGIDATMTPSSPTFGELWPMLAERLDGRPVVARDASFDMSVLRYELDHMDLWPATPRGAPVRCA
ncbi:MAG: hypothetical protein WCP98_17060 [Actinomycetes bacterium]